MLNGAQPTLRPDPVKTSYDDWVELLKHTHNEHMLQDPYNVWIEAFMVATMFERHGIAHALQTQLKLITDLEYDSRAHFTVEDVKQLQLSMLKQMLDIIGAKGMQRQGPTGLPS